MTTTTRFAFYGTLMQDVARRGEILGALGAYGAPCRIRGTLLDLGPFPGLVDGAGEVVAQIWEARPEHVDEALRILDRIEGYRPGDPAGSLYLRRRVRLVEPDVVAWTYVLGQRPIGATIIPSGDWRRRFGPLGGSMETRDDFWTAIDRLRDEVEFDCCERCGGSGEIHRMVSDGPRGLGDPQFEESADCPECDGSGRMRA